MFIKSKNWLTIICLIVGLIADIIAIGISIKFENVLAIIISIMLLMLLGVILLLHFAYTERKVFIDFISYLFSNNVQSSNVLPKVCLKLDKTKEYNELEVNRFVVKYKYDFSKISYQNLSQDSRIEYFDTIEYDIVAKNKNIPKEFAFHLGNEYAVDEKITIMQKHGGQTNYELVPPPRFENENYVNAAVQKYSWQIKRENITTSSTFPISFLFKYYESSRANSSDIIELYPKQYAKSIDTLTFEININCNKNVLADVKVYKVWRDKKTFKHTTISGVQISGNNAKIDIEPDCDKYEAYYLKVYWKLV